MPLQAFRKFPCQFELYSGCVPSPETLELIKENKIDCIWNLAREFKYMVPEQQKYVDTVLHADIEDYSIPDFKEHFLEQLNTVLSMLKDGKKVFVHCQAGHGRSGMVLACIKKSLENISTEEILKLTRKYCNGPEREIQVMFVKTL